MSIIISSLSFSYPEQSARLFDSLSLTIHPGWTAFAGANGSGKTTLALLIAGRLAPDSGSIRTPSSVVYCPQLFEDIGLDDYQYLYDYSAEALELRRRLGLDDGMFQRTDSLPGGEKKRLQLFLALSRHPEVLILDEPTNHLDEGGRKLIASALSTYKGIGILISHDRAFMDSLVTRTLIFSCEGGDGCVAVDDIPLAASEAFREREARRGSLLAQRRRLGQELGRIRMLEAGLQSQAEASARRLSKKSVSPKDHDAQGRIDAARLSGKDRGVGDRKKAVSSRREDLEASLGQLDQVRLRKSGLAAKSFQSLHSALTVGPCVVEVPGYSLSVDELIFPPSSRTALVGDNGVGKSLLVHRIAQEAVQRWGREKVVVLAQEYGDEDVEAVVSRFRCLDDRMRSAIVSDLYRLSSTPESFLSGQAISPGELRKLDFLLSLSSQPAFLIMDEPGNHLDITSLMAMEEMLSSSDLTLVLVSHDEALRKALCSRTVRLVREGRRGRAFLEA